MVMVLPNFWFGIYSMYSGSFLYEKFIYQLYNIVFTSLPIIWYSLFDFQHPKQRYLEDPSLYQLGLKKQCFSNSKFWFWIGYGAFQAALTLWLTFYQIELDFSNFWGSGAIVLMSVVLCVNFMVIA